MSSYDTWVTAAPDDFSVAEQHGAYAAIYPNGRDIDTGEQWQRVTIDRYDAVAKCECGEALAGKAAWINGATVRGAEAVLCEACIWVAPTNADEC